MVVPSACGRGVTDIYKDLKIITSKPVFTNPSELSFARSCEWKMPYHSFYRLLGFRIEGEVWEVIALKMRVDG